MRKDKQMEKYPQVLLIGNGLNRAFGQLDWGSLIKKMCCNSKIDIEDIQDLPFPLQAVLATDDCINTKLKDEQSLLYGIESIDPLRQVIGDMLSIPFDHILTTNYSYEIERVADSRIKNDGKKCKDLMETTNGKRAEQKYMLHTYNHIRYNGLDHKIWHIHGEARKIDSVIIGHYYYGMLLARCQEVLNKRKNVQFKLQQNNKPPIIQTWLDAFIMGDVHVLGFGYDFSEMDLWWLLNRKKREKADHGKLYFYDHEEGNGLKHSLMSTYGAEVRNLGYFTKPSNYQQFYIDALKEIGGYVNNTKNSTR